MNPISNTKKNAISFIYNYDFKTQFFKKYYLV